ncbi:MAG: MoaD/ThiS family protein [Verrucomicrobiales bacterium]|nr:MoaD/ThiS family protein [Verrucomicrobiae bacterium]
MSENDRESTVPALKVLFFSLLQEAAGGQKQIAWPVEPSGTTVASLLVEFYARWPELKAWDGQIRVAVDLEYVARDHLVKPGQEMALMPPVQGG